MGTDLRGTWLAILSACETGVTDYRDLVDEYQGLAAAFLLAGAATVVPSLWSVSDLSTSLLMQRFHENLYARRMAKAPALREAQRWLRDLAVAEEEPPAEAPAVEAEAAASGTKAALRGLGFAPKSRSCAHPYWWAAFQCVGAGWVPESGE